MAAVGSVTAVAWAQGTTQVKAWGYNTYGQCIVPQGAFSQVAAGSSHTVALRIDGSAAAWGRNNYGQCSVPQGKFSQIAAGSSHTVALRTDGSAIAWGLNNYGQCDVPQGAFSQIAAGGSHTVALRTDGSVTAWGYNFHGQCNVPQGAFSQVAAGFYHTVALRTNGSAAAWGSNTDGQCSVPQGAFSQIAAGEHHTVALRADGSATAWGRNNYGQCRVPQGAFSQIAAGLHHTVALRTDGSATAWGRNNYGQCDVSLGNFSQIAAGGYHTVALKAWSDCNNNGNFDGDEFAFGEIIDLDNNRVPDICQGATQYSADSGELGAPNPLQPAEFTFTDLFTSDVDAQLLINVTGDFDASNEYLTVRIADSSNPLGYITLSRLFETYGRNCTFGNNAATLLVPRDTFNRLAASGQLTIILVPSPPVTLGECPNGSMSVSLGYFGIGPDGSGDCDHDGRLDVRQIGEDQSVDSNLNSHLDSCEYAMGDFDLNGEVDTADLSLALLYLGEIDSPFGDLDGDGTVTTADVSLLLMNFGSVVWP